MNLVALLGRLFKSRSVMPTKEKISAAFRQIEIRRTQLVTLRAKLVLRQKLLFQSAERAFEQREKERGMMYATEHDEVRKMSNMVISSELALTQMGLRLESIRDLTDAVSGMTSAFKVVRNIRTPLSVAIPSLEGLISEVGETVNSTMIEIGCTAETPELQQNSEQGQDILDLAKSCVEQVNSEPDVVVNEENFEKPSPGYTMKEQQLSERKLWNNESLADEDSSPEEDFDELEALKYIQECDDVDDLSELAKTLNIEHGEYNKDELHNSPASRTLTKGIVITA